MDNGKKIKVHKLIWIGAACIAAAAVLILTLGGGARREAADVSAASPAVTVGATAEPVTIDLPADTDALPGETDVPEATAVPETEPAADTVMTVNGTAVSREAVEQIVTVMRAALDEDVPDGELYAGAIRTLREAQVLLDSGYAAGILPLSEEDSAQAAADAQAAWEDMIDTYLEMSGEVTPQSADAEKAAARDAVLRDLEASGYTAEVFTQEEMETAAYEAVYAYMVKDATVTDLEVEDEYARRVAADKAEYADDASRYEFNAQEPDKPVYYVPAGCRAVLQILLMPDSAALENWMSLQAAFEEQEEEREFGETASRSDVPAAGLVTQADLDAASAAVIASVQPQIDEIKSKLAAGASFAEVMAEYGTDPNMKSEPMMTKGYTVHRDSMLLEPALVQAAFSVDQTGQVSDAFVGSDGVHIAYYLADIPSGAAELTDALRGTITADLLTQKENDLYTETLNAWVAAADVQYTGDGAAMAEGLYGGT